MSVSPQLIGLTGGIGSGKSAVAGTFATLGATVVDADAISRQLTVAGGAAIDALAARFGDAFILSDGSMDRDRMRRLVFSDPTARRQLEAVVHPLVHAETFRQARQAAEKGKSCVVLDIPLLIESGRWRPQVNRIVVVDCERATQIERVLMRETGRPGWSAAMVEKIIDGQATRAQRLAAADTCIYNDRISLSALAALTSDLARFMGL